MRLIQAAIITTCCILLVACGGTGHRSSGGKYYSNDGPPADYRDNHIKPDAVPRVEPRSKGGNPKSYEVFGKRYFVMSDSRGYIERGIASWYGKKFHGRKTSNGEIYDMYQMSAAHKTLPIPTYVEVENLKTGKTIIVRVNDRGPFHEGRIIDLSYAAAQKLGIASSGTGLVEVRAIDPRTWKPGQKTIIRTTETSTDQDIARIYLQLGAFGIRQNAEALRLRAVSNSISGVFITEGNGRNNSPVYRVRVGPLVTVEMADQMIERLIQHGFSEFHVVIE